MKIVQKLSDSFGRDAKWSNGDAVTAADFVFGWQRAVDPANASEYAYMLSDIGQVVNAAEIIAGSKPVTDLGITAVDDKTLKVELNVPVSYFLSLMYFPTFYPVNEAFYNTCADTFGTSPDTVLSNGAFKLTDYQPAATAFTLVKNADYYDADRIALDGLNYQVIKDSQQALMSYQTGALDLGPHRRAASGSPAGDGYHRRDLREPHPPLHPQPAVGHPAAEPGGGKTPRG
ncbi:ABC transporter substrate-binding protein [Faecalibacterium prausnitzii]|uniref:ABC transporter substrate-binding protein n=1 Tax=Faecalibacterium prausnitzii TaxID=853 RepID=UPI003C2EEFB9